MIEVELQVPADANGDSVVKVVEKVCTTNDLICARKGTLASYPGSIHWHYKQGKQNGLLEISWWERESRLWFKVAKGRTGEWMNEALPRLKKQIEGSL